MSRLRAWRLFENWGNVQYLDMVYSLITASDLSYSRRNDWMQRFASWGGFESFGVRTFSETWLPSFIYFLHPEGALVAFTGTDQWDQVIEYVLYDGLDAAPELGSVRVVEAFRNMFNWIRPTLSGVLAGLPQGCPITFTGHSLGGAMAQLATLYFRRNGPWNVAKCVGFASPKIGDFNLRDSAQNAPIDLWRIEGDHIPLMPFNICAPGDATGASGLIFSRTAYRELKAAFVMTDDGSRTLRFQTDSEISGLLGLSTWVTGYGISFLPLNRRPPFWRAVMTLHQAITYRDRIFQMMRREGGEDFVSDLVALNRDVDRDPLWGNTDARIDRDPPDSVVYAFSSPTYVAPESPADVPIDPAQPVRLPAVVVEGVELSLSSSPAGVEGTIDRAQPPIPLPLFDPLRFESGPRRDWVHKAKDRRMLGKLWKVLLAMQARDAKLAEAQARGEQLAGVPLLDPADLELQEAFATLQDCVELQLSLFWE